MADSGIRTPNLPLGSIIEVLGHSDDGNGNPGQIRRQKIEDFVQALLGLAGLDPSGVADLSTRLTNEIQARIAADNALSTGLTDEATRADGVERALGLSIETEATTRNTSDNALSARIDPLAASYLLGLFKAALVGTPGLEIQDGHGHVAARFDARGLTTPSVRIARALGDGWAVTDERGAALIHVDPDRIEHPHLQSIEARIGGRAMDRQLALAQTVHIVIDGQSLCQGQNGGAPLSTTPSAYADMFVGGARPHDLAGTSAQQHASLTPLFEVVANPSDQSEPLSETPCSGCAQMINERLLAEDGIGLIDSGQRLLMSAPGQGGVPIKDLTEGGAYYPRLTDAIAYGAARAADAGRTYGVGALAFVHGEADTATVTGGEYYFAELDRLRRLASQAGSIASGPSRRLPMVLAQTATHLIYQKPVPRIALAQLAYAMQSRDAALATPEYFLPYSGDHLHLTATGYKWLGAYVGLALKRMIWDGVRPVPLIPELIERYSGGKAVAAQFPSAVGRLVLDTAAAPDPGNFGFTLADPSGAAIAITAVSLCSRDTVILTASAVIPPGSRLRYGWIGDGYRGGGCLRDGQGDAIVFDPNGIAKPMHRWAPIFDFPIT